MTRRSVSTFRVRYGETDQMGLAYHPNYLVWCEIGRTDYIRELGITYAEMERRGHLLAVADASVRYAAAARYDDVIRVETWLERVKSRTLTFAYEISRAEPDPTHLATARTTLISIDRQGAPRRLPGSVLDMFRETTP
ncbi:MAG TPA: thioesterase family protein [Longimicrobiales bacterium]|nr:thioesterase family protein [Longimicrobiales bacterium]